MGGSFNPHPPDRDEFAMQFIYNPRVEFNCRWDPEAAHMMLHSGWRKITAVPTDATVDTPSSPRNWMRAASASGTPVARYLASYGQPGFPMWDEVAAGIFIDPGLVSHAEKLAMDITIDHGANYGATLSWPEGKGPGLGEPDVTVIFAVDVKKLEKLFIETIGAPALPVGK